MEETKKMTVSLRLAGAVAFATSILLAGLPARAEYPERPITVIVPFAAGGPTDIISRIIADPVSRILKQQVVVENAVGAGGTVGVTRAKDQLYLVRAKTRTMRGPPKATVPSRFLVIQGLPAGTMETVQFDSQAPMALQDIAAEARKFREALAALKKK